MGILEESKILHLLWPLWAFWCKLLVSENCIVFFYYIKLDHIKPVTMKTLPTRAWCNQLLPRFPHLACPSFQYIKTYIPRPRTCSHLQHYLPTVSMVTINILLSGPCYHIWLKQNVFTDFWLLWVGEIFYCPTSPVHSDFYLWINSLSFCWGGQRHKHMSMKISVRKKYTSYHIYILIIHHQVSSTMLCLGYVQMHHWHSEVQALKFFFKRVGHFNFAKSTSIVKL